MVIAKGTLKHPLMALDNNTVKSSWFTAITNPLAARKQWIAGSLKSTGRITIDAGAERALRTGKSLLCAGVTAVEGEFNKGDAVVVCDNRNTEIARGLSSYNSEQAGLMKGLKSRDIQSVLGYDRGVPLIHIDNMVLTS